MDASKNLTDQQPCGISIQRDNPQATSDIEPPLEANQKVVLATERFQPISEKLADLERDDPKLAYQAARPAGLYRHIWASFVPKHLDEEKVGQNSKASRGASNNRSDGKECLQLRPDEQLSRVHLFEQASKLSQEPLMGVLKD
ncbi:unnamed protein product [Penicillium salamii]|uniref:Uncharacterized protein n=1 Tax=Penicillium salamii TaxID=1612424 RepID=A0A9W4K1N1_9EURO|nr:unnamed protein product [Penicillium salamii]CAG7976903.1 unnamed protein product [Penicillium salamii]CAG8279845.1 unnamed protein product [Penicillium salamii]CAG8425599.1 unnamed protein product [Penicillium salamii]CAG8429009.1 unnamed protein product [Penicillium salamii]